MPYIYCLSNPAMPGLLKIGAVHISDKSVKDRADELYGTGVPYEFSIELFAEVEDSRTTEKNIHALLNEYRVNKSREFFRIELEELKTIIAEKIPDVIWSNKDSISGNIPKNVYKRLSNLYDTVFNETNKFVAMMKANGYYDGVMEWTNEQHCKMLLQELGTIKDGLTCLKTLDTKSFKFYKEDNAYMKKDLLRIQHDLETFKDSIKLVSSAPI